MKCDKRLLLFVLLLTAGFIFLGGLFAQALEEEPSAADEASGATTVEDDKTEYYIRDFYFYITGHTRQFALIDKAELLKGEQVTGVENLEKYRRRKIQMLLNQRPLEYVEIRCIIGEPGQDGLTPVDLEITTRDSFNIIALPYLQYDDNSGFEFTIKARDYNFLGTLSPLRIDFGYTLDEDKTWDFSKGSFNIGIDSDIPFTWLGFNWNFDFDNNFSYTYQEPVYYKNITGLSMKLPVGFTTATFGFEQNFILNERNGEFSGKVNGIYDPSGYKSHGEYFEALYGKSSIYNSWKIPTGLEAGNFGELTYTPKITTGAAYGFTETLDYLRKGFFIALGQKFGFERIDWLDNYRDGLEAYIENSNTFNFSRNGWINSSILFSTTYHKKIADFFGVSGRLRYKHWFFQQEKWIEAGDTFLMSAGYNSGGDVLRGIIDRNITADYMLSFNLDLPLRVLKFTPSKWLEKPKLRIIDFDLHFSPFIDLALVRDPVSNKSFSSTPSVGSGFELIVFPYFFRSFYVRASFGYNMNDVIKNGKVGSWHGDELFIGIGHFY
jgi:hypothetical protein